MSFSMIVEYIARWFTPAEVHRYNAVKETRFHSYSVISNYCYKLDKFETAIYRIHLGEIDFSRRAIIEWYSDENRIDYCHALGVAQAERLERGEVEDHCFVWEKF